MSISKKIKEWYAAIEAQKFRGIAESIMEVIPKPNAKFNQQMDSLLARLTHSYIKYSESNVGDVETGLEVFNLTCCLCDRFSESTNPPRLRSGIFHISRCLRDVHLYSESVIICNYTKPGRIFTADSIDSDYFFKLSYAWRHSAEHLIKSLSNSFDWKTYSTLLEVIKYEFELLRYSKEYNSYCQVLFLRFRVYIEKITASTVNWNEKDTEKFFYSIIEHLKTLLTNGDLEVNPSLIYKDIIDIIRSYSFKLINSSNIDRLSTVIMKLSNEFKVFIQGDVEVEYLFDLHIAFCEVFMKPVISFDKGKLEEIRRYRMEFASKVQTFDAKALLSNAFGISKVLTPLTNYWLECMRSCDTEYINEISFELIKLVQYVASIFEAVSISTCKCNMNKCKARKNSYEGINALLKCGTFLCLFDQKHLSTDILHFVRDFIISNVERLNEFKKTECGLYQSLWSSCGQIMYNLSLTSSLEFLDESVEMFSNLCSFIIREYGIKCKHNFLRNENPLSLTLYKLSGVYYRAAKYREAMIITAFNGLISYEDKDSKAFKMWANIKYKVHSGGMMKQTMVACLKADQDSLKEIGVEISLEDYNLVKLYAREIQGLLTAKVNLSEAIKAALEELELMQNNTIEFVEGVLRLGYHVLCFRDIETSIAECIKKGRSFLSVYKEESIHLSCLDANLSFLKFIERLNERSRRIKKEMKNTKNILQKDKNGTKIHDQTIESEEIVPVYRMINMKEDINILSQLEKVISKWEKCFNRSHDVIHNYWDPQITLDMIIIAGEIARLYSFQSCEKRIWILAHRLASIFNNRTALIYVTARSISLRYINDLWIQESLAHSNTLTLSKDEEDKSVVAMFWISLADFYFEQSEREKAVELLKKVENIESISLKNDVTTFMDFMDTVIRNYQFYSKEMDQKEYSEYIVYHIYSMISTSELLNIGGKKTYYGLNSLFDCVNHLSLVLHNFISFREISAHLFLRLELAQSLGATLKVAECLVSLCFIDLSRFKLDDCEMKLQGLEQILDVEEFGLSMKSDSAEISRSRSNTVLTSRYMDIDDPLRDIIQNEASPILKKKIFVPPEFLLHDKCNCYRCENIPYQYLVFSCTHIRAQIYALKNYSSVALQHFDGAFGLRARLLEKQLIKIEKENCVPVKLYPWNKYYSMVSYVLFLLDFSKFLMGSRVPKEREAMEIAVETVYICKIDKLETHPVYFAAQELVFQYRFKNLRHSFNAFRVPAVEDIDVLDIVMGEKTSMGIENVKPCFTPSHSMEKYMKVNCRKKVVPLLALKKIHMALSDSEDEDRQPPKGPHRNPTWSRILGDNEKSFADDPVTEPISDSQVESSLSNKSSRGIATIAAKRSVDQSQVSESELRKASVKAESKKHKQSFNSSLQNLLSKIQDLKLEDLRKTPMFTFLEEELEIMKMALSRQDFQHVFQFVEELKLFNFALANSPNVSHLTRSSRSRSKHQSSSSENKTVKTFDENKRKIMEILTNAVLSKRMSSISVSDGAKMSPNRSECSSPDLFSTSDDNSVQLHKENTSGNIQKLKSELSSVRDSLMEKRIYHSKSTRMTNDSDTKKTYRVPRKKS